MSTGFGEGLSRSADEFDILVKSSANQTLITFGSFLLAIHLHHTACLFAGKGSNVSAHEISVLFKIDLNFGTSRCIRRLSLIQAENETLLATESVFCLAEIVQNETGNCWEIKLGRNGEVNTQLSSMINHLKEEIVGLERLPDKDSYLSAIEILIASPTKSRFVITWIVSTKIDASLIKLKWKDISR